MIVRDELLSENRQQVLSNAVESFTGDPRDLSNAIGFYHMGLFFGWRFLYMIHGKRMVRKYEKILSIKVSQEFNPISEHSYRSSGLCSICDKQLNYWKVVTGEIKVPGKRHIQPDKHRCVTND